MTKTVFSLVASWADFGHTGYMATWLERLQRLWRGPQGTPPPSSHVGGQGIPNILGVCEQCGAIVVEGLHQPTASGHLCRRCANRRRRA